MDSALHMLNTDADKALDRITIESLLGDIAESLLYGYFVFDAIMHLY